VFEKEIYIARRKKLIEQVGSGMILLLGNEESGMNYKDNWYPFRQDSTFLYFIGLDKADLVAIIDIDNNTETLFGNDLTVDELVWNGYQQPLAEQAYKAGITKVKPLSSLDAEIKNSISANQKIHFLPPYRSEHSEKLSHWLNIPIKHLNNSTSIALIKAVVALRSIKTSEEITEIEKAVNITAEMHLAAIHSAKEGLTEAAVAGVVHSVAIKGGGNLSFPTILTTNGQILHNHYKNKLLPKGRIVLCDCGAETELHYAGDLTRTFPVDAKFTNQQREVYDIVLAAHNEAVKALKPSTLFKDVHLLACEKLTEGLQQLGLMKGNVKEAVHAGAHALFFQCGLGHMMGLDVHDMENLGEQYVGFNEYLKKSTQFGLKSLRLAKPLETGFVLTVEPGLYFIPELIDLWAAEKKFEEFINYDKVEAYKNFGGIRVENDYLITEDGSRLLGDGLPITADEIEVIRASVM
jgi:Xaa-Pro aminopeptidase